MKLNRNSLEIIRNFMEVNSAANIYVSDKVSGKMVEIKPKADWDKTVTSIWVAGNKKFTEFKLEDGTDTTYSAAPSDMRIEAAENHSAGAFSARVPLF